MRGTETSCRYLQELEIRASGVANRPVQQNSPRSGVVTHAESSHNESVAVRPRWPRTESGTPSGQVQHVLRTEPSNLGSSLRHLTPSDGNDGFIQSHDDLVGAVVPIVTAWG